MDQRRRKLMTMHKALDPRDDIDRLCVSRKEGGKGLSSIEDCIDTPIRRFRDYIKKNKERLITVTRNSIGNIKINRTTTSTRKQK